ncbi:MAG: HAD hydrolase-like protein [Gemmatimonadaceae bacterium]|nr:HAD hydrolase-like protein [Gemmatimonadaceae bacterium]
MTNAPLRLVAFDFDGTLADSFAVFSRVFDEVARRFGVRQPGADEVEVLRGLPTQEVLRRLEVPMWRLPALLRFARTRMAAHAAEIACVAGVPSLLHRLSSRGVIVAVVSSNSESMVRTVLGASVSAHVHSFRCGVGLFGKGARLRALVRRYGGPAAFVGDEERDVAAARAARMLAVAVTWGYASAPALRDADALCASVSELADRLGYPGV